MEQIIECAERLHSDYVKDDCIQIMLAYKNFAQLYGNGKLMFYQYLLKEIKYKEEETALVGIDKMNDYINDYINDERKKGFPYASIPVHKERLGLFQTYNFANQIFDYEKPYIKVTDGIVTKLTAYKDKNEAIIHTELISNRYRNYKELIISREELENYLKTGTLDKYDNKMYKSNQIFDSKGGLYDISLKSEDAYFALTKYKLFDKLSAYNYVDEAVDLLKKSASNPIEQLPFLVLLKKRMIKFDEEGNFNIDFFTVIHVDNNKYKLHISQVPLTKETLLNVKDRLGESNIKYCKRPKINSKITLKRVLN